MTWVGSRDVCVDDWTADGSTCALVRFCRAPQVASAPAHVLASELGQFTAIAGAVASQLQRVRAKQPAATP